ncbi:MAG: prepilin peptidase [Lachnospiraceae bacterium]|nr:prepilin peptidase [Lachnospiraceae bacterium]MDY5742804.1 prepilin peptidase [Lachnospiraceae bacterium]
MRELCLAGLLLTILAICSRQDLRDRRITLWPVLITISVAVVLRLTDGKTSGWLMLIDAAPGIGSFLLCRLRPTDFGEGDAWIVLTIGLFLGWQKTVTAVFLASLLAAGLGGAGLLMKRLRRDSGLPFVPFLLGGVLLVYGCHLWS